MLSIHGSEKAVREYMRQNQAKSRKTYKGTGGFAARNGMSEKEFSEFQRQNGLKSYAKKQKQISTEKS